MHLSLYRKYRPATFEGLVRQEHVVRILKNQIMGGTIGHAYLFCGPRGTGKTTVARIFAKAVNCEQPKEGSPCGVCPTCRALEGSLDVTEIDAASNNGVNEMRDLREKVQYPPVTGKYKVYIIDEVHMLTDSAFNALLKTLEEPPVHAIFILATTEPHKIPSTILSRCMRLDFKLIPEEDLEKHLISILDEMKRPYEREAVSAIARAGAGSDRDMLSVAEMCLAYSDKLTYADVTEVLGAADFAGTVSLVRALLKADMSAVLERTEEILAAGKSVGVLCHDLLEMLNRVAVAKTCRTAERLLSLPKNYFALVKEAADEADGAAILRATSLLSKAEYELRFVSSPRICLETAMMKISLPEADESNEAILVRLNALEKRLAEGTLPAPREPEGGSAERKAEKEEKRAERQEAPVFDEYEFPTEEPVFDEGYFSEPPAPPVEEKRRPAPAPIQAPAAPVQTPAPAPAQTPAPAPAPTAPATPSKPAEGMTAQLAFGKFLRALRRSRQNGVLYTMCSDLEATFEGGTLVLSTESDTVFTALKREEHRKMMGEVFREVGVDSFEVRKKGVSPATDGDPLKAFAEEFKDYPIEYKP